MSDHVNTPNEPGLLTESPGSTTGFDVTAAADEVRAELAPATAPAAARWTAADYGWDPSDDNAVAWAAYYSDLGVDPTALAAQQAAEASAARTAPSTEPAATDPAPDPELVEAALSLEPELEPATAAEPIFVSEPALASAPALDLEEPAAPVDPPVLAEPPAPPPAATPLLSAEDARASDLAFAPVHTLDEPGPGAVPVDLAPGAADGGSAIWELLPADPGPAAKAQPELEAPRHLPARWSADERARAEEFQLASGGSFDEATAPIGDLGDGPTGELSVDGFAHELPPLDLGLGLGLGLDEEPAAASGAPQPAADPLPLPDLDLAAPAPELSIDLGFVEDDPVAPAPPVPAAEPPEPLPFDLDLETPAAAAAPASAPAPAAEPELDLGWAARAVPADDNGVDLASFDAEPHLDVERRPDGTAMWGLPGRPSPAPSPAPAPAPAQLLGDADPLPTPAPLPPSAELGEPLDGSLFLEPIQNLAEAPATAAPQSDPWDALAPPAAPADLAPESGPGPFDLGAPEEAPPIEASETILEVGEEVVEIAVDASAQAAEAVAAAAPPFEPLSAEPAPAPAEAAPPEPPAPAEEEPPPAAGLPAALAPEPAAIPPAPALAAAAPPPPPAPAAAPPPSCFIAGAHRVVVHTSDGQVKRGTLRDTALDGPQLQLLPQPGGAPEPLPAERVKAIFFMLATGEQPPAPEGKKVRVTFRDGRQVAGFSPDYAPERAGFFMVPADTRTHTARIWVYRASVRQVTVSP